MKLCTLLTMLMLTGVAHATPTVVRSGLNPLRFIDLDGAPRGASPLSPAGFGLSGGNLRYLVSSVAVGAVVVDVVGQGEGGLFAVPVGGGSVVRLGASRGVDASVALSPDGRWLGCSDRGRLRIVHVTLDANAVRELDLVDPRPWKDQRFEQLAWHGSVLAFTRSRSREQGGRLLVDARLESVSLLGRWQVLVPNEHEQDRPVAQLSDGRVLLYRNAGLQVYDPSRERLSDLYDEAPTYAYAFGAIEGGVLIGRDRQSGRRRFSLDAFVPGHVREVLPAAEIFADPRVAVDGASFWVTVQREGAWNVERVALADGARVIVGRHAQPVELVHATRDGRAVGCRGDDVVVIADAVRVIGSVRGLPSCTVRAVMETSRGPVVVYEAPFGNCTRTTLQPVDGGPSVPLDGAQWVGSLGDHVVLQTYLDSTTIVDGDRTLVPWMSATLTEVHLSPDQRTVVYRMADDWYAADADGQRRIAPSGTLAGLTDDRLALADGGRVTAYRFDGRDAAAPIVCLERASQVTPVAPRGGRIAALRDGQVVSVALDGSERLTPRVLGEVEAWSRLLLDPVHERVVFDGDAVVPGTLLSAPLDGRHGAIIIARDARAEVLEISEQGNVVLVQLTSDTAVPRPMRWDFVATNGSGPRPAPPRSSVATIPQHRGSGRDTREVLAPYRGLDCHSSSGSPWTCGSGPSSRATRPDFEK